MISEMRRAVFRIAAACMLFGTPAIAGELQERDEIDDQVSALFRNGRFADLERMAEEYRTQGSRTSSGIWKNGLFYAGIEKGLNRTKDESYWSEQMGAVTKWIEAFPTSPTPRIAEAIALQQHAWAIRGGGWARDVREEDWAPFHRLVAQARDAMLASKEIGATDPNWYETMLEIATIDNWDFDRFNALFDEATWKYKDYYPSYFAAIRYLAPKWHGSVQEIERFADRAVVRTREIEGRGMYARIYWYASQMQFGEKLFQDSAVAWPKMKRGIADVLKQYPDQWNINNFAHFACLAGDREETARLTARVTSVVSEAWAKDASMFARCRDWANGPDEHAPPPVAMPSTRK